MAASTTTAVNLANKTTKNIALFSYKDFFGSDAGTSPNPIGFATQGNFTHKGDSSHNSVGGVAYSIEGKIKWIVAWNNKENERNKVVTKIVSLDNIDWDGIRIQLEASATNNLAIHEDHGYRSAVEIEEMGATPKLQAALFKS